ncbi:M35 family metallo-endopeptidase [Massilia sp. W12]|uniref:M35 family metallo-endopeptidase n=1 Tax=Massilia sp. W12 TaxID=3126507 RepID=UPI0030CDC271
MKLKHTLRLSATAIALLASFAANAGDHGVKVTISPVKNVHEASDDVFVNVTLTNTGTSPKYVLKYLTPFSEQPEHLFEVTRDGKPVQFLGAHIKRGTPKASDYLLLKPGKSYTRKVELSAQYDMSISGDYKIQYHVGSMNLFNSNPNAQSLVSHTELGELESNESSFAVNGIHPRGYEAPTPQQLMQQTLAGSLTYTNCTSSQKTTVASAVANAKTYASNSLSYLNAGNKGARYTTWFGTYDAGRYSTVKSHFSNILNSFNNQAVVVDCGCTQSYYAYVYPTQPYKIYVCKAFWSAPMTGTDSKAGTMVHEMSHFNVVGGTDDWAYGQSAAKSLATSNPGKAVDNADSHEYFAENTPFLN